MLNPFSLVSLLSYLFHFPVRLNYSVFRMKTIHAHLAHLLEVITSDTFKNKFFILALRVRQFLKYVIKLDVQVTEITYRIAKKKTDSRFRPLGKPTSEKSSCPILEENETKQAVQILRASLTFKAHRHNEERERQLFFRIFPEGDCQVTLINGGQ